MPTGYTHSLDEQDMDTGKWIMEHLSRAFGMCVCLRDESMDLTEEQIIKRIIESESIDYHLERFERSKEELLEKQSRSDGQWKKDMKRENENIRQRNDEWAGEAQRIKEIHKRVKIDLQKILDSDAKEISKNVVKFGIEQLEVVKSDCKPYKDEIWEDVKSYKANVFKSLIWDIKYYSKELAKTKKRNRERLQFYLELQEDINRIL